MSVRRRMSECGPSVQGTSHDLEKSEAATLVTTWMTLEIMTLRERRQTQKATECVVPCM